MSGKNYTEQEIAFIINSKDTKDWTWNELAEKYNKKFNQNRSAETIRECYKRYVHMFSEDQFVVKKLREIANTKKNSSLKAKENRIILERLNTLEDILEVTKNAAREILKEVPKKSKFKKVNAKKRKMTKELLLSDIHFGKLTHTFNLEVLHRRLQEVVNATVAEMDRDSKVYDVERLVIAFLGDIIESNTMHGPESAKGCEFGNSRQVYEAQVGLFKYIMKPLLDYCHDKGILVDVVMVTGNHDRTEEKRTFNDPGEENVTYTIYNTIKDFVELAGYTNVTFDIPICPWSVLEIYGSNILYEHYDNAKNDSRVALENLMNKRATNNVKKHIHFMRGGHFHNTTSYDNNRIQINGSFPGNDSYSTILGFDSPAAQILNSYVKTNRRNNSFYRSFVIQLEDVK
jgi:predicted MPP superfamily phosphohydrolase